MNLSDQYSYKITNSGVTQNIEVRSKLGKNH